MRASGVQSRHRNIFAKAAQSVEQFRNVNLGASYLDNQPLRANEHIVAFPFGEPRGSIAVVKNSPHAIDDNAGVLTMAGAINGHDISPFDKGLVACACEDGTVGLFSVPLEGLANGEQLSSPSSLLEGHEKRVLSVVWHPRISNVLASHDGSKTVKVWDASSGQAAFSSAPLGGLVTSIDFDGATAVVFGKDHSLSLFDVRAGPDASATVPKVHEGTKGGRAAVLGGKVNRILCTGFAKNNAREAKMFDPRNLAKPLYAKEIDNSSSSSPFVSFDEDLSIVYIWGKGDGNIRVYEATENTLIDATEFKSNVQQSGLVLLPKQSSSNIKEGQIGLLLKLTPKIIDVLHVLVPRAGGAGFYDAHIWPDTWDGRPLADSGAFFGGAELGPRNTVSLAPK